MAESTPQSQWAEAWARAWSKMPVIPKGHKAKIKTKTGADYEYSYADLPDIIDAVRPVLAAEGLSVGQSVDPLGDELLGVVTRVYHKAGHVESFGPTPMPAAGDPRTVGSAITYARRYSLSAALGIASDEDTDAAGTEARNRQNATSGPKRPLPATKPSGQAGPDPLDACKAHVVATLRANQPSWTESMAKDARNG